MTYFPIYLDLRDRKCLVAGAGKVGTRKIAGLAQSSPAEILVVEPEPVEELLQLIESSAIMRLARRDFEPADLEDRFLVIASTGDAEVNRQISRLCKEKNILCNIVDQPELSSFIVPAQFRRGQLSLAVSTQGSSPALARHVRERLEDCFGPEYSLWTNLLGILRHKVLALDMDSEQNRAIFRSLCREDVLQALQDKDWTRLERILQDRLPRQLWPEIEEVLHELA